MKTSIATVSLSGSLTEKLHACAAAGFDGVELFEPDLIANDHSPEEIRALSQPARPVAGPLSAAARHRGRRRGHLRRQPAPRRRHLRHRAAPRHRHRPGLQQRRRPRPSTPTRCRPISCAASATSPQSTTSRWRSRRWPGAGSSTTTAGRGASSSSPTTRTSGCAWTASTCCPADTTRRRSRTSPADKIFFLQLADAPALTMDVLSWSRHHRLFPGEGAFDLPTFVSHVLAAGYDGPLSLEVFNDTFRQTDPDRTAVHALRSLLWLQDKTAALAPEGWRRDLATLTDAKPPTGFDFVELKAEDTSDVEVLLGQLGFTPSGRHRTKPVSLWSAGDARVVLNEQQARDRVPHVAAVGLQVPDAVATSRRAAELMAPAAYRRTYAAEQALRRGRRTRRHRDVLGPTELPGMGRRIRERAADAAPTPVRGIDHVNLAQPWQTFDDAVLFFTSVFGFSADAPAEVPGPERPGAQPVDAHRRRRGAAAAQRRAARPRRREHAAARGVRVLRRHRAGARCAGERGAAPARSRQLLRLPVRPVRPRRRHRRRAARTRPALRPRTPAESSCTSTPAPSARCSSSSCSGAEHYDGYGADNAPVRLAAQRGGPVGTVRT